MRRPGFIAFVLAVAVVSFLAGSRWGSRSAPSPRAGDRKVLYYVDPMNPSFRSSEPGIAPCGMALEPVYEEMGAGSGGPAPFPAADGIHVPAERQQAIGVRLGTAERGPATHRVRTVGRVAADENRLVRLNAATELWIRRVHPVTAGEHVRKDQPLLAYYSPNFLSAANAYMFALGTLDRQKAAGQDTPDQLAATNLQIRQAVEGLQILGVSDADIDEMARTRAMSQLVTLRSPIDGFVLVRNATVGEWISPGTELYQVASLDRVWILADVYEGESQFVKPGVVARVAIARQNRSFDARVSQVLPQFDPSSRTLKVRLETPNPGFALRPGMFVDVEMPVELGPAITVPKEAVLDSGTRRVVYVAKGDGVFEPRKVETGFREGDRVEIVSGLAEGEKVVTSGNFLLDSESRMRTAGAEEAPAGEAQAHGEARADATASAAATAIDPICGMTVDTAQAKAAGRTSTYEGRTYYFCAARCKETFEKAPAAHAKPRS